jgi:hypothetical protein
MKQQAGIFSVLLLLVFAGLSYSHPKDQPYMEAALSDLQKAKAELQVAEHNKGGHRANAVGYVNSALSEVNKGIDYARRHNHAQITPSAVFSALTSAADQPHMQAALDLLKDAKTNLASATDDKGGHRVKAMEYVDKAIDEVNLGIAAGS